MVSIWLTKVKSCERERGYEKNRPRKARPIFINCEPNRLEQRLLAILLDSGRAQTGKAVLIDRVLPGEELVDGQRVAAAGLFKREQAATNRGHNFSLTANDPPFCPRRGQIRDGKRATVRPDDVFHPRAMGFCHGVLTNS